MGKLFKDKLNMYHQTTGLPISAYTNLGEPVYQIGMPILPLTFLGNFPKHLLVHTEGNLFNNHKTAYGESFLSLYVADYNRDSYTIVVGPFKHRTLISSDLSDVCKKHTFNSEEIAQLRNYFCSLSTIKMGSVYHHYKFLDYLFNNSLHFNDVEKSLVHHPLIEKNMIEYREIDFYHHHYLSEKLYLTKVLKGINTPEDDKNFSTLEHGTVYEDDYNRNQINKYIIGLGIFEKYAINNGLDPETSFKITHNYLKKFESCKNTTPLKSILLDAIGKFQKALYYNCYRKYSKVVKDAIYYVNLHPDSSLKDVANFVQVHPNYLSKLTKRELGISLSNYILWVKINEAKILLRYSNASLSQISRDLHFSSKSYFIQCFKKTVGMTPSAYSNHINTPDFNSLDDLSWKDKINQYFMTTGLPIRVYTENQKLIYQIGMPNIPYDFLGHATIKHELTSTYIHSTDYDEHFILQQVRSTSNDMFTMVIGPFKCKKTTLKMIKSYGQRAPIDDFSTVTLQKYYFCLPLVNPSSIQSHEDYIQLLFHGMAINRNEESDLIDIGLIEKDTTVSDNMNFYNRYYTLEKLLIEEKFKGKTTPLTDQEILDRGIYSKNYARKIKDIAILNIGLFERYAIEHGLDTHQSLTIGDTYLRMIEKSDNLADIDIMMQDAFRKYMKAILKVKKNNYSKTMDNTIHYIHHHLSQKLTLKDVADYMNVSQSHLSRLITKELGMSFTDYVLYLKIEEAKKLLQYSNNSLLEISDILNFSSKSYFAKCFKKVEGITPTEYVNQLLTL